jgi:hypothetical protein
MLTMEIIDNTYNSQHLIMSELKHEEYVILGQMVIIHITYAIGALPLIRSGNTPNLIEFHYK